MNHLHHAEPVQAPDHECGSHSHNHEKAHQLQTSCESCACAAVAFEPIAAPSQGKAETWHIPNMDCPVEEKEIRQVLAGIQGIHSLSFHLSSRSLIIDASEAAKEKAREAIKKAGFKPETIEAKKAGPGHDHAQSRPAWKLGIAFAIALSVEILHFSAPETFLFQIPAFILAVSAIVLAGASVYFNGLRSLLRGQLNISALMAVAVTGAFILGQWAEAAMVMVLYAIAELIEAHCVDRARHAIRKLLSLAPKTAELRLPDGQWDQTPVENILPGQAIRVKPGERIPLDGIVLSGHSAVNQMPITGESIPVAKILGDTVYAGSINESGVLELGVTAPANDTLLARIITTVEQAQEKRAPIQRFIDRFAAIYTPAIFAIALAVAALAPFLAGWAWQDAFYRALVLLVIACPCALVIATPLTVVSGLTAAARDGILIKGGIYLEEARKLKAIAFDKTGTITQGHPVLVAVEVTAKTASRERILNWAAAMTSRSNHPVSRAIFKGIQSDDESGAIENVTETAGKGVEAIIGSNKLALGSAGWMNERGLITPELDARLQAWEESGYTVSLLASGNAVLALFAVADMIRANSAEAVKTLISRKIAPVMLTGDNPLTAQAIASQAGITEVKSGLLPQDKLAAIETLRAQYRHIAMVGDGINDAPALAAADIGIAMGGAGTDIAMETADIVIMNDDLRRVADLIHLSRQTFRTLQQNIGIALGIKLIFFALALIGQTSMWMAVFADVGATLIVVGNGLRLLRWKSRFTSA